MMTKLDEVTTGSEVIYQGKILNLRRDTVILPDGRSALREIVEHQGAVAVLAVTAAQEVLLVRQFRKPVEEALWELPAGKLEVGEEPAGCAKRELLEETGYTAANLTKLYEFYTTPGFSNEKMYLYLASGLTPGAAKPDADEFLNVKAFPLPELLAALRDGRIKDGKTIIGLLYLQAMGLPEGV